MEGGCLDAMPFLKEIETVCRNQRMEEIDLRRNKN